MVNGDCGAEDDGDCGAGEDEECGAGEDGDCGAGDEFRELSLLFRISLTSSSSSEIILNMTLITL